MLPKHLTPECGEFGHCKSCEAPVKASEHGGWYITMGHAGFNSKPNNGAGYKTREAALQAHRKYAGK